MLDIYSHKLHITGAAWPCFITGVVGPVCRRCTALAFTELSHECAAEVAQSFARAVTCVIYNYICTSSEELPQWSSYQSIHTYTCL